MLSVLTETFPFSAAAIVTFAIANALIVIVPGPTITLIVANALRHGARAGLANVAGTQAGVASMIIILAFGLETMAQIFAQILVWIKFIGAAYLIWIGIKLWRSSYKTQGIFVTGAAAPQTLARPGLQKFFWQGFAVLWSNPKAFFFFGAFILQFINPTQAAAPQILFLGALAVIIGTTLDGAYAILAGRAGTWLTRSRLRIVERISGTFLIGGGIWLALSRQN